MRVAIYGIVFQPDFQDYIILIFKRLHDIKCSVLVYKPFYDFISKTTKKHIQVDGVFTSHTEIKNGVDYFICIGGDGTFLETINYVRDYNIPILGINSGKLGFLAYISKEEINTAIEFIEKKKYSIEERTLIKLETSERIFGDFSYALNEFSIHKKNSAMITIHVSLNGEWLNTYWADGLIISTPTGSTAYSLSAGGPIVTPDARDLIIAPISPHNLTVRPIVIPDHNEISIRVESRETDFIASLDHRSEKMDTSVVCKIGRACFSIKLLTFPGHSFFSTLRNKLMWGIDKRN